MEAVRNSVKRCLPGLSVTVLKELMSKLEESGCENVEDCQYVTETDLCPPLKPEQCRKLLSGWATAG